MHSFSFRRLLVLVTVLGVAGNLHSTVIASSLPISRRRAIVSSSSALVEWGISAAVSTVVSPSHASETIGKNPDCNEASCLGVWDGLLADCPHGNMRLGAGCTSSQDDTPGIFAEPWDYSESDDSVDWRRQMKLLVSSLDLICAKRGDTVDILTQEGRYLRVMFVEKSGARSVGEFYFTPNDTTVQFRIAEERSSNGGIGGSLRNKDRAESIRQQLRYLKLPVLRNRKRSLFFVESDLDTFGPGSAALGPPSEMRTGELEGRGM